MDYKKPLFFLVLFGYIATAIPIALMFLFLLFEGGVWLSSTLFATSLPLLAPTLAHILFGYLLILAANKIFRTGDSIYKLSLLGLIFYFVYSTVANTWSLYTAFTFYFKDPISFSSVLLSNLFSAGGILPSILILILLIFAYFKKPKQVKQNSLEVMIVARTGEKALYLLTMLLFLVSALYPFILAQDGELFDNLLYVAPHILYHILLSIGLSLLGMKLFYTNDSLYKICTVLLSIYFGYSALMSIINLCYILSIKELASSFPSMLVQSLAPFHGLLMTGIIFICLLYASFSRNKSIPNNDSSKNKDSMDAFNQYYQS